MSASDYVVEKTTLATGLQEWRYTSGRVVYRSTVYIKRKGYLKTWEGINRSQAKTRHKKRDGGAANGDKPAERLLLSEVKEECYSHLDDLAARHDGSAGTVENYRAAWKKRIAPKPIAEMRLDQIERADCLRFLRDLRKCGLSESTQNGTVTAVRVVLRYAREMNYMTTDPFAGIARTEFPSQTKKSEKGIPSRVLTNEEGRKLIEAARSEEFRKLTDTVFTNMVIVARFQGARNGEVCGLRWRDIDLIEERIGFTGQLKRGHKAHEAVTIVPPKNKEEGERSPQMFTETWAALNDQLAHERSKGLGRPDDLVFTTAVGDPITHRRLLSAVKRAGKLAGLGRVSVKDLRTSFVTVAVHAGIASVEIETMTGHTAAVIERFYAKPYRTAEQAKENVGKMVSNGFGGA